MSITPWNIFRLQNFLLDWIVLYCNVLRRQIPTGTYRYMIRESHLPPILSLCGPAECTIKPYLMITISRQKKAIFHTCTWDLRWNEDNLTAIWSHKKWSITEHTSATNKCWGVDNIYQLAAAFGKEIDWMKTSSCNKIYMYMYIYIYMCVCVFINLRSWFMWLFPIQFTHIHFNIRKTTNSYNNRCVPNKFVSTTT